MRGLRETMEKDNMAITATKKLDQLNQKIALLKQEQEKIQGELAQEFLNVIRNTQALTLDFTTLIGGVLETITKIQSGTSEVEDWQKAGGKFLKSLAKNQAVKDQNSSAKAA